MIVQHRLVHIISSSHRARSAQAHQRLLRSHRDKRGQQNRCSSPVRQAATPSFRQVPLTCCYAQDLSLIGTWLPLEENDKEMGEQKIAPVVLVILVVIET